MEEGVRDKKIKPKKWTRSWNCYKKRDRYKDRQK